MKALETLAGILSLTAYAIVTYAGYTLGPDIIKFMTGFEVSPFVGGVIGFITGVVMDANTSLEAAIEQIRHEEMVNAIKGTEPTFEEPVVEETNSLLAGISANDRI